jgi:DNA repair protein RadC
MVAMGSLSEVEVHPREIFRGAILAGAQAVILVHNHPSGDVSPSPEDLALTRRLKAAGELLGIPMLDHLIVAQDRHQSLIDMV